MAKQSLSRQLEKEEAILHLRKLCNKTEKIYNKIRIEQSPGQNINHKIDGCDALMQTLERKWITASLYKEDGRSIGNRSSRASTRSRWSGTSRSPKAPSLIYLKKKLMLLQNWLQGKSNLMPHKTKQKASKPLQELKQNIRKPVQELKLN